MKRALVVEDSELLRNVLTAFIEHTNKFYDVDSVSSGEEAMKLFEPGKYDLVVLDIVLPKMSGVEVSFLMRQQDKDVVIIAATGHAAFADQDLTVAGINELFLKPLGYVDMFDYIRAL